MSKRLKVKPSKQESLFAFLVGIVFVGIGIFIVIPSAGAFGVFWTMIAIVITVMNATNAFSEKGIPHYEIEVTNDENFEEMKNSEVSSDDKLRRLKALLDDGILSQEEYEIKKEEILKDKWV